MKLMCKVLSISNSGYYRWRKGHTYLNEQQKEDLKEQIKKVYGGSRKIYGYRRVFHQLLKQDVYCYLKQVETIMREAGLVSIIRKKYRSTTDSDHGLGYSENLLKREFDVEDINKVWVSDITSIWTSKGWAYLVVFIDLCSRYVVSWQVNYRIDKHLVVRALHNAINERKPEEGLIIHSDRGSQYCSNLFRSILKNKGYLQSMSRKGDCWDNAVAESFFKTLKVECTNRNKYKNIEELELDLFNYIELFYNRNRIHSNNNYLTPYELEKSILS